MILFVRKHSQLCFRLLIFICSFSLCHSVYAQQSRWQSRGIGGGGALYSPSISLHDSEQVFMATDMSAVFQSKDFGRSWRTLPFRQLRGGIGVDMQFTSDPNILYSVNLANDSRIPVKSIDGGLTFERLAGDPSFAETYSLFADQRSTERIVLSSYNKLFFSADGGASFSTVFEADDLHLGGVYFDHQNDDSTATAGIFVGGKSGLLVSMDNGQSFERQKLAGIPEDEAIVSFVGVREGKTLRFFAVTLGHDDVYPLVTGGEMENFRGLYRLDWNGTKEWRSLTSGLPKGTRPFFIKMANNNVNTVYVAGGDVETGFPIVAKSEDGGVSWRSVFNAVNNENIHTGWVGYKGDLDWRWSEIALGFTVAPQDANKAVITDYGFVHRTSDGGDSWHQAYVKPEQENPAGKRTPKRQAYSTVGVEDTSAWWLTWIDENILLASFTDIRGLRSQNGGETWSSGASMGLKQNSTYNMVQHPTTDIVYAASASVHDLYQSTYLMDRQIDKGEGLLLMSSTAGASWREIKDFGHPVISLALDPNDAETLYAAVVHSQEGGIYKTHNLSKGRSASWTRLTPPMRTQGHPLSINVLDDGALAVSYSGRRDADGAFTTSSGVFYSTDAGQTWQDRSHQDMLRWTKDLVIDPNDGSQSTWYAGVFSHWGATPNEVGGLFRTKDRGQTWTRLNDLYRVESSIVDPSDPNTLYVSTETDGLWVTQDLHTEYPTFTEVSDFPFQHPVRMFYSPQGQLWVTTFGGGLFEAVKQ